MGGTSTDVALIDGKVEITTEGTLGSYPVSVPMLDMQTIGAGGGSIAFIDAGGLLRGGPESAGANPGPACYGQGGIYPTVTDAQLVLERLSDDSGLAGGLKLDSGLALAAIKRLSVPLKLSLEEVANGIIQIANEHMMRAIRLISVNRGHDPKEFALVSFGGAGGLHVCEIADGMQMKKAVMPVYGGVLSALGMLVAEQGRQFVRTVNFILTNLSENEIETRFAEIFEEGRQTLTNEGVNEEALKADYSLDCRYLGQSYTLNIPWDGLLGCSIHFGNLHEKRYGYSLQSEVEIVNLRVLGEIAGAGLQLTPAEAGDGAATPTGERPAYSASRGEMIPFTVYDRETLRPGMKFKGPCVIEEVTSTTIVDVDGSVEIDEYGSLVVSLEGV